MAFAASPSAGRSPGPFRIRRKLCGFDRRTGRGREDAGGFIEGVAGSAGPGRARARFSFYFLELANTLPRANRALEYLAGAVFALAVSGALIGLWSVVVGDAAAGFYRAAVMTAGVLTNWGVRLGAVVQALVLSPGLADRVNAAKGRLEKTNASLEELIVGRTGELERSLQELRDLKVEQDGDYFLTSLLIAPLTPNRARGSNLQIST